MCSIYAGLTTVIVISVSWLANSVGMFKNFPRVVGAELDTWLSPPWPAQHTDSQGRALAYQEDGRWQNPWMKDRPSPLVFFKSWFFGSDDSNIPSARLLEETLPVKSPLWRTSENFTTSPSRLTWLGHATVLAEIDNFTVLTDPMFSQRASMVQFAGPKRYTAPACRVSELPDINAVVISHNHYDHLDLNTVTKLAKLQPNIQWFVPAGLRQWLLDNTEARGETVRELTWWEEVELEDTGLRFVFTPANHWCKRGLNDDNKVLWGSWAVLGPTKRFWFGGDTGYCEAFKSIGDNYGPFDLAAIPIGAYQPNWFMKYQHVHPGEAVEIHKDIKSRKSLGIHWGTFKLTTENYLEPPALLNTFLNRSGLENDVFVTTDIGSSIEV